MADTYLTAPKPPLELSIPESDSTVKLSCIDSTSRFRIPMTTFLQPDFAGRPDLVGPSFSFLIEHPNRKPILFDLGVRKDWDKLPSYEKFVRLKWDIHVPKDVATILKENGVDVDGGAIESIVWSHHHWDHVGDPSTFSRSTGLVIGPGFTEAHLPGQPKNMASTLLETDFEGRNVREIDIEREGGGMKIGRFWAFDYFGDGSFYLLDTPGHSVGHICGLARTTSKPDTFVFMGGDAAHHGGEFRPTEYLPLPTEIRPSPLKRRGGACPGHMLQDIHPHKVADKPFYYVTENFSHDKKAADWTIDGLGEFDAHDNILMMLAHDEGALDLAGLDFYPKSMNDWHGKGVGDKLRWLFVADFEEALESKEKGGDAFTWGTYP